jgi:uncharacterized damage-inducible protein DinB
MDRARFFVSDLRSNQSHMSLPNDIVCSESVMGVSSVSSFLDYYGKIRQRTLPVVRCIPPDKFDWTYQEGKFSLADLIRHIATIERYLYAETVQMKPSRYLGHCKELVDGPENVVAFMDRLHAESVEIFGRLSDEDLEKKCMTPTGAAIAIGKWLRAMVEHEIHHRGQIYVYLAMLGISTPPIYGLTSEEVRARSQ